MGAPMLQKRHRVFANAGSHGSSKLFAPFRTVGLITNATPFHVHKRGTHFLITTSIGNSWQTFDCRKFELLFISPPLNEQIKAISSYKNWIIAAAGAQLVFFERSKEVFRHQCDSTIEFLLQIGNLLLISTTDSRLFSFDCDSQSIAQVATFNGRVVTALCHPPTYVNKVIVGFHDGSYLLFNIKSRKTVHDFEALSTRINCIATAPALDIVSFGLQDGFIHVRNVKTDELVMTFKQRDSVLSLSFRSDGGSLLASAGINGDIFFWDLEKQQVFHHLAAAHADSVSKIEFLDGQPLLLSSSADNSMKQWIFDSLDGFPRLLKFRSSPHKPLLHVGFYSVDSHFLLVSGGDNTLRAISCYNDAQSCELSQGAVHKLANKLDVSIEDARLPTITCFVSERAREKDWCNILTGHHRDSAARMWSWQKKLLIDHVLRTSDRKAVSSVAISACGNFGFVGSSGGQVDVYNMQSAIHRRTWSAHNTAITGIALNSLNKLVVTSSKSGEIKFWHFTGTKQHGQINFETGISRLKIHRASELIAASCDDFCVRIIDASTMRVVREFSGHLDRITDLAFSDNARWVCSASLDGTIRTWDLPSGQMCDVFKTEKICVGLSFSESGDYLATIHSGMLGVSLWTNLMQFRQISITPVGDKVLQDVQLPAASGAGGQNLIEIANAPSEELDEPLVDSSQVEPIEQLSEDLITLSLVPKTKWQTLVNLERIRERNKPLEPPQAPTQAPFFLPSAASIEAGKVQPDEDNETANSNKMTSALTRSQQKALASAHRFVSSFSSTLRASFHDGKYDDFVAFLRDQSAAEIDGGIRGMAMTEWSIDLEAFVRAMTAMLSARRDFELSQAWMVTFLRIHSDAIMEQRENKSLRSALEEWRRQQRSELDRLDTLLTGACGVIRFLQS